MKRTNEEGERVSPIYDVEGLLTSISLNCDELRKLDLPPDARTYVEGIQHMVGRLINNAEEP